MDAVGLDDQDESVRIAVKALGDMRNSANSASLFFVGFFSISFLTFILAASRTTLPSSDSPAFVERMSHIPFVNSALRVYEQGKASSRMVKVCRRPFSPPLTHTLKQQSIVWRSNHGIECENYIKTSHKSSSCRR